MGDNRDNSQDSRYWGFLPRDEHQGQGAADLLVVRVGARRLSRRGSRRIGEATRVGRDCISSPRRAGSGSSTRFDDVIRRLFSLVVILLIANATVRVGLVWIHYQKFKDAVSETVLFAGTKPDDALRDKVMQIARDNSVPLDPTFVTIDRAGGGLTISASVRRTAANPARLPTALAVRRRRTLGRSHERSPRLRQAQPLVQQADAADSTSAGRRRGCARQRPSRNRVEQRDHLRAIVDPGAVERARRAACPASTRRAPRPAAAWLAATGTDASAGA